MGAEKRSQEVNGRREEESGGEWEQGRGVRR